MKKLTLITLSCLSYFTFLAQDSVSVLFIGNSYTYVNDLPTLTNNLTNSLGDILTFDSQTIGGASFALHAGNATTYQKIHTNPWDFVVLQGQSQELSFPTDQVNTESLPYIEQLADSVHGSNYCSQILLYMTWGRQNGDPQWDSISTFNGMNERLTNAAVRMADSIEASLSPVAVAWKYVRDNYPSINLYASDGSHPSFEGSYLAACTFYASLFRKSPIGATYIGTLDQTTATTLQTVADLTVLNPDSLIRWNLHALSDQTIANFSYNLNLPDVSFSNSSIHGTTFHWDFGDGQTSTENNPTHTYTNMGTFDVELIAFDECDSDTIIQQVIIFEGGINSLLKDEIIFKNSGDDVYSFENLKNDKYQISMTDSNGKLLLSPIDYSNKQLIDLSNFPRGMYYVKLENNINSTVYKIVRN